MSPNERALETALLQLAIEEGVAQATSKAERRAAVAEAVNEARLWRTRSKGD